MRKTKESRSFTHNEVAEDIAALLAMAGIIYLVMVLAWIFAR